MRCPGPWECLCASTSAKRLSGCSMRVAISHRGTSRTSGHLFKATKAFLGETWENRDIMSRHWDIQAILHTSLQKRAFASQTLLQTTDWGFFLWSLLGNLLHQSRDLFLHVQLPTLPQVCSLLLCCDWMSLGAVCTWSLKQAKCYCRNSKYTMRMCQSQSFSLQVFICTQHTVSTGTDWVTGRVLTLAETI